MNLTKGAAIRLTILFVCLGIGGASSWQLMLNPASLEQAEAQAKLLEQIYVNGNYLEALIWFCLRLVSLLMPEKHQEQPELIA
jgi:hypothetical protein